MLSRPDRLRKSGKAELCFIPVAAGFLYRNALKFSICMKEALESSVRLSEVDSNNTNARRERHHDATNDNAMTAALRWGLAGLENMPAILSKSWEMDTYSNNVFVVYILDTMNELSSIFPKN